MNTTSSPFLTCSRAWSAGAFCTLLLSLTLTAPAGERTMQTYVYKTLPQGEQLHLDLHRLPGDDIRPVIFFIHGGALMMGDRQLSSKPLFEALLNAGYAIVSIDYRLAPNVKLPAIIEDVRDAYNWVIKRGPKLCHIDPKQVFVAGLSAGGYLTQMTGFCVKPSPRALVSFWGYGDLTAEEFNRPDPFYLKQPLVTKEEAEKSGGMKLYIYGRQQGSWPKLVSGHDPKTESRAFDPYCPIRNVTKKYPPTMLVHGTKDTDVPYACSVQMDKEFTAKQVPHEFVTIQDGVHGFRANVDAENEARTYNRMLEFLDKYRMSKAK